MSEAPDFDLEATRRRAQAELPPLLRTLAERHGLHYDACKITSARKRWGSCVGRRTKPRGLLGGLFASDRPRYTINLSLFTVLLPPELQELILLHELTHTIEMNHSPRFHQRLNAMLGGREKELEAQLKQYKI